MIGHISWLTANKFVKFVIQLAEQDYDGILIEIRYVSERTLRFGSLDSQSKLPSFLGSVATPNKYIKAWNKIC